MLASPQKKSVVSLRNSGDSMPPKAESSICSENRRASWICEFVRILQQTCSNVELIAVAQAWPDTHC